MIWCCGMYSSGSTWAYNATRAAAAACGVKADGVYADTYRDLMNGLRRAGPACIVKSHALEPRATEILARQAEKIVLTIRDPRDAAVSIMQHMRLGFTQTLNMVEQSAIYTGQFAKDPRALLLRYESGFIDNPATFDALAALFGGALTPELRAALFRESRRDVIDAKIAHLEDLPTTKTDSRSGDVVDTDTQWHRHHAHRTGEVGKWRTMLTEDAVAAVETRLGRWMAAFGYEMSVPVGDRLTER
jgi:hypothetical protein